MIDRTRYYDIIVVGAGHAGCEAAHAAARMGCSTLLISTDLGQMSQFQGNPRVGGPARSHLVREIDALGGLMGWISDRAMLQIRLLNEGKGPAVQALRAQIDPAIYSAAMQAALTQTLGLTLLQAEVVDILVDSDLVTIRLSDGGILTGRAGILTVGCTLRSSTRIGTATWSSDRPHAPVAAPLWQSLAALECTFIRHKTSAAPQVAARSINLAATQILPVSPIPLYFGHYDDVLPPPTPFQGPPTFPYPGAVLDGWRPQLPCYQVWTTEAAHATILHNLAQVPLYNGSLQGVGPRYCRSIEDKIVRNPEPHSLILEPMGWDADELYVQGADTSLPEALQAALLHTIPALAQAHITRPGYAVEYDVLAPGELGPSLALQRCPRLFVAGQVVGSSGSAEAAALGLLAGINAARLIQEQPPIILKRAQAYIGVLISDLVQGVDEPYRMRSACVEHRLALRGDNADLRLTPLAGTLGLVNPTRLAAVEHKRSQLELLLSELRGRRVTSSGATNVRLAAVGMAPLSHETTADSLLRRPGISYDQLRRALDLPEAPLRVMELVEVTVRYESYTHRQSIHQERRRER